jgi:hypothetical protein
VFVTRSRCDHATGTSCRRLEKILPVNPAFGFVVIVWARRDIEWAVAGLPAPYVPILTGVSIDFVVIGGMLASCTAPRSSLATSIRPARGQGASCYCNAARQGQFLSCLPSPHAESVAETADDRRNHRRSARPDLSRSSPPPSAWRAREARLRKTFGSASRAAHCTIVTIVWRRRTSWPSHQR